MKPSSQEPDKKLAAVCGLFCEACSWFIATAEDPERLQRMASRFQLSAAECRCTGCRSDQRLPYCWQCRMAACAAERGLDFCSQCAAFPCDALQRFQAAMPHRLELWGNLARIKTFGYRHWLLEIREHYACPGCGTLNSAYDLRCQSCGAEPSCGYVAQHRQAIEEYLKNHG
ncbi:MAG: DUF3795 domain-containing protein [Deltaproteobacteria bacterium]|nr:DUF3795 domain-containing protein [Deltaproteobacteria bacterium]